MKKPLSYIFGFIFVLSSLGITFYIAALPAIKAIVDSNPAWLLFYLPIVSATACGMCIEE